MINALTTLIAVPRQFYNYFLTPEDHRVEEVKDKILKKEATSLKQLAKNPRFQEGLTATLETIGASAGEMLVSDTSPLPPGINPGLILASLSNQHIGQPIGHILGLVGSLMGSYFVCENLPSLKDHKKELGLALMLLLTTIELYELNPVSNFLGDITGKIFGDLTYYTVALLSTYIGMKITKTKERFPDYLEKMIPSMIAYYGSTYALETIGTSSLSNFLLSCTVSHVVYNSEKYKQLLS